MRLTGAHNTVLRVFEKHGSMTARECVEKARGRDFSMSTYAEATLRTAILELKRAGYLENTNNRGTPPFIYKLTGKRK